ncbi:MAG TPA: glycosyltransferase, partial [Candidatus Bathyarchaeia archaeon]|nr:glycosyltransferase [Candidatus Bathyarchaeia archaeon]
MNILFLTSTLPRFAGDSQAPFVLEQAQAWKNARPDDTIIILAPGDSDASRNETWNGIAVNRFTYFYPRHFQKLAYPAILPNIKRNPLLIFQIPFFLFSQFWVARRLCKKYNITLVYAHWVMPQGITAYLLHGLLRIPYILQNHSSDLSIFRKIPIFGKSMARAIINKATRLFCVNCILKDEA